MLHVTFPEITRVLEGLSSSVAAAESHGCLCGALCRAADYPVERWLEEIVPEADQNEDGADEASDAALRLLYSDTLRALRGDEMELELLLPDDNIALELRATALSQWCQGFLYGFGTGQRVNAEELPADVDEILRDMTHIGRATVEVGEGSEEEEEAYAEVVEYVRVGVQLVHDELGDVRSLDLLADASEEPEDDDDPTDPPVRH
jgi:uncharacterized protein